MYSSANNLALIFSLMKLYVGNDDAYISPFVEKPMMTFVGEVDCPTMDTLFAKKKMVGEIGYVPVLPTLIATLLPKKNINIWKNYFKKKRRFP